MTLKRNTKINTDKVKKVLNKGPFYFIRFALIAQIIIFAIMFSFDAILKIIPEKNKFEIKYNIQKIFVNNKYNNDENSLIYCLEALNKNEYLDENNKVFIKEYLLNEIKENKEFINIKKVAKRLETLKVNYNKKYLIDELNNKLIINDVKIHNLNIAGRYNSFFNEINMYEQIDETLISKDYNDKKFGFNEASKTAYFHELNHVITDGTFKNSVSKNALNSNNIYSELINEVFAREYYFQEISAGYEEQIRYMYVFAEILPEDVLRKFKFNDNESILISGLLDIDNDIEKAFELMYSIEHIQEENSGKKIHDLFEHYYTKVSGEKIKDNMNILAYLYDSKIISEEEKEIFENYVGIDNTVRSLEIIPKGYFSNEYIKEYPSTIVKINNAYSKTLK